MTQIYVNQCSGAHLFHDFVRTVTKIRYVVGVSNTMSLIQQQQQYQLPHARDFMFNHNIASIFFLQEQKKSNKINN